MKFSVDAVEALDYDFTGYPRDDGKGMCTGKGRIPEPSQKDLQTYYEDLQELTSGQSLQDLAERGSEGTAEHMDKLLGIVAKLCKNQPSQAELKELPPRILMLFIKWLGKEFNNPEV